MNQLQVIEQNGQLLVGSRDVAEMVGKQHKDLLESIRGYIKFLMSGNFRPTDFFIEHSYLDSLNRTRPCYLLTKKGCDMVANKLTGEKGVLFTAEYVTRFEEMEKKLSQPRVLTEREQLIATMKLSIEHEEKFIEHSQRISKLEENLRIDYGQQNVIQKQINKRVYKVLENHNPEKLETKVLFSKIHRNFKDAFNIPSYKDLRKLDFEEALSWISSWRPLI